MLSIVFVDLILHLLPAYCMLLNKLDNSRIICWLSARFSDCQFSSTYTVLPNFRGIGRVRLCSRRYHLTNDGN